MQHRAKPSRNALRLPSLQQLKTCRKSQESSSESESDSSDSSDSSSSGATIENRRSTRPGNGKMNRSRRRTNGTRNRRSIRRVRRRDLINLPSTQARHKEDTASCCWGTEGLFRDRQSFPDVREILKIVRKAYPQACSEILGNETRKFVGHRSLLIY